MTTKFSNLIVSDDGDDDGGDGGANGAPVDFDSILHSYLHSPIFKKILHLHTLKLSMLSPQKSRRQPPYILLYQGLTPYLLSFSFIVLYAQMHCITAPRTDYL